MKINHGIPICSESIRQLTGINHTYKLHIQYMERHIYLYMLAYIYANRKYYITINANEPNH